MGKPRDLLLTIDTASPQCALSLSSNGNLIAHKTSEGSGEHFEQLSSLLDQLLREANFPAESLTRLAVGVGPGSFTGIRIGMSFAKGLAWARGVPLVGFCSLRACAASVLMDSSSSGVSGASPADTKNGALSVAALADAGRNEVYFGLFPADPISPPILAPTIVAIQDLSAVLSGASKIVTTQRVLASESALSNALSDEKVVEFVGNVAVGGVKLCPATEPPIHWIDSVFSLEPSYVRQVAAKTIAERAAAKEAAVR